MPLGPESLRSHNARIYSNFYNLYCRGRGADIGYKGGVEGEPIPNAMGIPSIGVDTDTPGYDGLHLPFKDNELDFLFSSHTLEHLLTPHDHLKEWFRVVKPYGHLIIMVPHQFLYEKKLSPPSLFNGDHKAFITPAKLLGLIETTLTPNTYRIRHMRDNDTQYTYHLPPEIHCGGACEIELVLQKITKPEWDIK